MKDFIIGTISKAVTIFIVIAVIGMGLLTVYTVSYTFNLSAIGIAVTVIVLAVLWQVFERIREGKANE